MPMFLDWHEGAELNQEMREQLEERMRTGERDEWGVRDRGIILDEEANRMYCMLEAPDEEAIHKHHEAAGIPVDEIHRADAILPE